MATSHPHHNRLGLMEPIIPAPLLTLQNITLVVSPANRKRRMLSQPCRTDLAPHSSGGIVGSGTGLGRPIAKQTMKYFSLAL
ncbi:hypothetical protein [Bradyrhizobium sp. BRP23]|uniref:hypothetical protein n=1 Tax=Bradyrhizobium sp. BRP23 TaxID=2793820 RepID=UPI001CD63AFE|nr:hypothetical protein [Bradyrhizobium sp. BRP23]MCA1384699.1 hypothetical protein [Bradyrhizobium sp. BRP05]MCA1421429.1 hypothetical protein [Bradyrhizobium sp. BRP23]